jgi:enoyl-CoA hydratase/carnithine racemase
VIAEWMGHWTALQLLGIGRAAELFFTGRVFLGREAAEWGLANSALPAAEVLPAAMALAAQIAEHAAPVPLAVTKRLLWESLESGREVSGRRERLLLEELLASPDAAEGVRSFLAKRQPRWTGRSIADAPAWPD